MKEVRVSNGKGIDHVARKGPILKVVGRGDVKTIGLTTYEKGLIMSKKTNYKILYQGSDEFNLYNSLLEVA